MVSTKRASIGIAFSVDSLDVGEAPAQSHRDDQDYGDHAEISGLLSSRGMLRDFRDHQESALKLLRMISGPGYSHDRSGV
jgi:hypothetical protein